MDKYSMLEEIILYYTKGNKALFSRMLGVKPQTINTWLNRNTFDAELIYANCESISGDWLLSGEGEMIKSSQNVDSLQITNGSTAAVNVNSTINAPITASSSDHAKLEALTAELAHANALLESTRQILSEREQLIKEKERLIQLLLKQ